VLFGVGFYQSVLPVAPARVGHEHGHVEGEATDIPMAGAVGEGEGEPAGLHLVEGEPPDGALPEGELAETAEAVQAEAELSPPPLEADMHSEIEAVEVDSEPDPEPPDDADADMTTDQRQQR
jgi:hypothetical protein